MLHYVQASVPRQLSQARRDDQAQDLGRGVRVPSGAQPLLLGLPGTNPTSAGQLRNLMALQQTAGNRAVVQLMQAAGASPNLQRCGPGGCGDAAGKDDEDAPVAQRVATFPAGPVHQVNNLADCVVNGPPVGVTWPTLNGTQFWTVAAAQGALVRPTLTTSAVAAGGFQSQVDTVPTNTGSYDETVLARGPWRLVTPKATIGTMLPALAACAGAAGDTRFRAFGNPSDTAMFQANRRHENHHANDHKVAFRGSIKAWDTRLTRAKARGTTFPGATAAAAEAALWTAMGGTPDEVAQAFMDQAQAAVIAYHGSAAGGPVGAPTSPGARNNCDISWAKYRNPS